MKNTISPLEEMIGLRTANAAFAQQHWNAARLPDAEHAPAEHGVIMGIRNTRTANAEWFQSTHYSEPMTVYATGWRDPEGWDELIEFIAPAINPPGEYFQYLQYFNPEQFLSDYGADDDIRAIGAEFKTVDYSQQMTTGRLNNRGLRVVLDYDRIKNTPNWQGVWTGRLLSRLKRNQARRAVALAAASGSSDTLHWTSTPTLLPDDALLNECALSGDSSGIPPTRLLIGETAWLYRLECYGILSSGNQFAAAADRARTPEQLGMFLGLECRTDKARYQGTGSSKTRLLGTSMLLYVAHPGTSEEDPSNFKLAWGACQNGQRYAVYIRQIDAKRWEIVVEHYELLFAPTVLGCRVITAANT